MAADAREALAGHACCPAAVGMCQAGDAATPTLLACPLSLLFLPSGQLPHCLRASAIPSLRGDRAKPPAGPCCSWPPTPGPTRAAGAQHSAVRPHRSAGVAGVHADASCGNL